MQDSGLFLTLKTKEEEQEENDVLIKKQDGSLKDNAKYSTSTDFNIFAAQLNKSRKGITLEVSHEKP